MRYITPKRLSFGLGLRVNLNYPTPHKHLTISLPKKTYIIYFISPNFLRDTIDIKASTISFFFIFPKFKEQNYFLFPYPNTLHNNFSYISIYN